MHIVRYRRKVVSYNLRKSFPEKGNKELKSITAKFYRNLSDTFFEIVKASTISLKELSKRIVIENPEIINNQINSGKSVLVCMAHRGNWEWLGIYLSTIFTDNGYAVYKPIVNIFFNNYLNKTRSRFNDGRLIPFKDTSRIMLQKRSTPSIYLILSDQSPAKTEIEYQTVFLNQLTPVYLGIERLSKAFNYPVLFIDILRIKRGYYKVIIKELVLKPKETKQYDITKAHLKTLEDAIRTQPDNWLWSHRRWKYAEKNN